MRPTLHPLAAPDPRSWPAAITDERAIVERAAAGDRGAFEWIMRRYNRRLYRLAYASLRDEAEAKDAVQEAYLRAYRGLATFRAEAALSTWLARIVLNECMARRRRSTRREKVVPVTSLESHLGAVGGVADMGELPDRAAARSQMRAILEHSVGELPDSLRVVFVLRAVEELSVEETARCLEIPEETVRTRHFRARGLLREALARDIDLAERDLYDFAGLDCDALVAAVLARLPDRQD